jgi:transcriptional regulator with GAF, ATPase, and Fis domain
MQLEEKKIDIMYSVVQYTPQDESIAVHLPTMLEKLMELLEADFLQLVFNPTVGGEFQYSSYCQKTEDLFSNFANSNKKFIERNVKDHTQSLLNKNQIQEIDSAGRCFSNIPFEHFVYLPITISQKRIGLLTLCYKIQIKNTPEHFEELAKEWALILTSILAQRNAEQTIKENEFILGFGNELTSAITRKQLMRVAIGSLQELLHFDHSTFFLFDKEENCIRDFFSEEDRYENPFVSKIDFDWQVLNNKVYRQTLDSEIPHVFCKDDLAETNFIDPFFKDNFRAEIREFMVINLLNQKEIIGYWILACKKKRNIREDQLKFLSLIASQITMGIINVLAHERIQNLEKISEIRQALNIDFVSIRDKSDLLKIIHHKLKDLFDLGHHFVGTINDDDLTMTTFLQDKESKTKYHPLYGQVTYAKFPINDGIFNKVLLSKEPVMFDLDTLSSRGKMPDYLIINYESGIKKMAMIGLQVGAKIIGIWSICLLENQFMSKRQLNLFKEISSQLSVAIDNIKVNEAVESKESEREMLLQLSADITSIREKEDLLNVINKHFKKLFFFEDMIIMMQNEDQTYQTFLFSSNNRNNENTYYQKNLARKYPCKDSYFSKILETKEIVRCDMEQWYNEKIVPDFIKFEYEAGIKEKIAIRLREDNRNIGALYLNASTSGNYTDHDFELIKGVSYQISTAVSNILVNEEIARREAERELLISLSIDIAAVRNNNELLQVITHKLKDLLMFSHTVISTINDDGNTVSAFLLDPDSKSKNHPTYQEAAHYRYLMDDGFIDKTFASPKPVIFDLDRLSENQELSPYLQVNYESGIRQAVMTRFSKGEKKFGIWMIFFDRKININNNKLSLIQGLTNQISVAVSNIMANEEINRRECEKGKILAFSNAIASVRDNMILGKVLKQQLFDLFDIEDYAIYTLSEDRRFHNPSLFDRESDFVKLPGFTALVGASNSVEDGVFDLILKDNKPTVFYLKEIVDNEQSPICFSMARMLNKTRMIGVPIRLGQEIIAIMTVVMDNEEMFIDQNNHLLESICSQIAITVANIKSNEQVNNQLREINRYKQQLEEEKTYLKEEIETTQNQTEIVGNSPEVQNIFRLVTKVAASDSTVLILGETGTGKELIARAIHNNSPRKNKLMIKVNCAALPANLIESELFGHERGSFTGATERRLGKFELANNGTLFLDEIGEMPLELQVKLLRALQEKEIERVGGKNTIKIDVRIIAATNRDLEQEMNEGRFRSDLYYRLNIFPITLPPLRERRDDIPLLASHFILWFAKKSGKKITNCSNRILQELMAYHWPGNIRELEHLIERSVLLAPGNTLNQIDLPVQREVSTSKLGKEEVIVKTIDENEHDHIIKILKYCKGKIAGEGAAAELLGVPPSTLNSKIKRLGIKKEYFH